MIYRNDTMWNKHFVFSRLCGCKNMMWHRLFIAGNEGGFACHAWGPTAILKLHVLRSKIETLTLQFFESPWWVLNCNNWIARLPRCTRWLTSGSSGTATSSPWLSFLHQLWFNSLLGTDIQFRFQLQSFFDVRCCWRGTFLSISVWF